MTCKLNVTDFCRRWRNIAWGDRRYDEFRQEFNAHLAAARRAGAEETRKIDAPVIEAAREISGERHSDSQYIAVLARLRNVLAARGG